MSGNEIFEPDIAEPSEEIPHTYIVKLIPTIDSETEKIHLNDLRKLCAQYPSDGSKQFKGLECIFKHALKGYTGEFHPKVEEWIKAQKEVVVRVEADVTMQMAGYVKDFTKNWGLARISLSEADFSEDKKTPGTMRYIHSETGGQGVVIHILDDGYKPVDPPYVYAAGPTQEISDDRLVNGDVMSAGFHGFVAAVLAAGSTLGAAPKATISVHKVTARTPSPRNPHRLISMPTARLALKALEEVTAAINDEKATKEGKATTPRIINCSWGIERSAKETLNIKSFEDAVKNLTNQGCIFVVAAGNHGEAKEIGDLWPTGLEHVITVGASHEFDNPWPRSNYGKCVDIYAPGVDLPMSGTATNDEGRLKTLWTGTSFAAPIVSGVIACILADHQACILANPKFVKDKIPMPNCFEIKALLVEHLRKTTAREAGKGYKVQIIRNYLSAKIEHHNCLYCVNFHKYDLMKDVPVIEEDDDPEDDDQ